MKATEIIAANIKKSVQKDIDRIGYSRFQCDTINPHRCSHLLVAFRNGYELLVYDEKNGTVEVNVKKNGEYINDDSDYAIEFLNAIYKGYTYDEENNCRYATGCYSGLSVKLFVIMFKYFKSIK